VPTRRKHHWSATPSSISIRSEPAFHPAYPSAAPSVIYKVPLVKPLTGASQPFHLPTPHKIPSLMQLALCDLLLDLLPTVKPLRVVQPDAVCGVGGSTPGLSHGDLGIFLGGGQTEEFVH